MRGKKAHRGANCSQALARRSIAWSHVTWETSYDGDKSAPDACRLKRISCCFTTNNCKTPTGRIISEDEVRHTSPHRQSVSDIDQSVVRTLAVNGLAIPHLR